VKTATKKTTSAPAADKPAAEKKAPVAKKQAAAKTATPRKTAGKKAPAKTTKITAEQRYRMIAEAAYYRAESCQFKSDPLRDWIEAERDIAILLREVE
jgi:alpha-beta hydrolase superfamily lysophospholipase